MQKTEILPIKIEHFNEVQGSGFLSIKSEITITGNQERRKKIKPYVSL